MNIVTRGRPYLTAISLVMALAGSISLSAFAGTAHRVCTTKQHDCGQPETIKPCCCGDQTQSSDPAGPIAAKMKIVPAHAPTAALFAEVVFRAAASIDARGDASPPRAAPVDLPTLFARLLI